MRRLLLLFTLASGLAAGAAGLKWDAAARTFDADLDRVELGKVLEALAAATRWDVRVEPGTRRDISARFERQPEGAALAQLLDGVNFLVLPQPGGARRLLVYRTAAGNATERVRIAAEDAARAARGAQGRELLVTLKPGTGAAELAERLGAKVTGSLEGLDTYRLEFADAEAAATAAEQLANDEEVEAVEFNQNFARPETPQLLAGVPALNFDLTASPVGADGKIIVALVDSAIPANNRFADWLLSAIEVAGKPGNSGGLGHGEAMLEAMLQAYALASADGQTMAVRILPVDVYGAGTETSTFNVAAGIMAAVKQGADIVNLSLGGPSESALLKRVLGAAVDAGSLPVAAAGNLPT
ncbi:MAG: S8 family serine peptidase, partial [Limisphaerales bacterium]